MEIISDLFYDLSVVTYIWFILKGKLNVKVNLANRHFSTFDQHAEVVVN